MYGARKSKILWRWLPLLLQIVKLSRSKSLAFSSSILKISHPIPFCAPKKIGQERNSCSVRLATSNSNCCSSMNNKQGENDLPDPSNMRISEIKSELKELKVSCNDCFDKESICERLKEARNNSVVDLCKNVKSGKDKQEDNDDSHRAPVRSVEFDKIKALDGLRALSVRELKTMCGESAIRWAYMIEKEEMVQSLLSHKEKVAKFSPSRQIIPGKVAEIDDVTLSKELSPGLVTTPLLLDIYATWCGPCKLLAPQLVEASIDLGENVRVAKLDSDKFQECTSRLKIVSFPTLIVFDGKTGNELERVEGALMKDDLIKLGRKHS